MKNLSLVFLLTLCSCRKEACCAAPLIDDIEYLQLMTFLTLLLPDICLIKIIFAC